MDIRKEVFIPTEKIYFDAGNTNEQDDVTFNALVEQIEETGFTENIVVVDHTGDPNWEHPDQPYLVVSGNHRGKAAQVLGIEELPARIWNYTEWDEDTANFQNIRHNVLRGKLNSEKFTKMFMSLSQKYGEQATKDLMKFVDEDAFKKVYKDTLAGLPKEIRDQVEKSKKDIKSVDDLSNLLNTLFSTYGDTLAHDYMVFDYGGRQHIWIQMDAETKEAMNEVRAQVMIQRVSMNALMGRLVKTYAETVIMTLPEIDSPDIGDLT